MAQINNIKRCPCSKSLSHFGGRLGKSTDGCRERKGGREVGREGETEGGREGERERERERERGGTDRQTQTDRHRQTDTDTDTDRQTEAERGRDRDRDGGKKTPTAAGESTQIFQTSLKISTTRGVRGGGGGEGPAQRAIMPQSSIHIQTFSPTISKKRYRCCALRDWWLETLLCVRQDEWSMR